MIDGVATVNGITRDVLNVKPGDTVTLTADTTKFPENEEFGWWEITPMGLFQHPDGPVPADRNLYDAQ